MHQFDQYIYFDNLNYAIENINLAPGFMDLDELEGCNSQIPP